MPIGFNSHKHEVFFCPAKSTAIKLRKSSPQINPNGIARETLIAFDNFAYGSNGINRWLIEPGETSHNRKPNGRLSKLLLVVSELTN